MAGAPILITIPISHYCEKARWALDRAGIAYTERPHLQLIHWIPVARAGGKKTAPVLVWGDRVFAESAEIVEEASARAQPGRAWQRRALPLAYPLAARVIDRYLDITPAGAERSEAQVRAVFDSVGERLGDGRRHLCGERFSAADLTFASLAASLLMPPQYGVPLPQPDGLPAPMAAKIREFRAHPAGEHALRMFQEERR